MENVNPPPTNNPHILLTALHARVVQELSELQTILNYIDCLLERINRFLSGFTQQPNGIDVDDLEPDDESVDTPLVSPLLDSDDDSSDGEVLNELEEYATNIVLQGLPLDVYAIVNHHKVAKEIWDRVKLLMQGTKLSLQEKECKLYEEFDNFSFVKGETLYQYYWRFAQLINNINVINMLMRPVQVNTKFLNSLPPEWSKVVMDVKLAKDLHTTNFDQLYSYLEQHEAHANETRLLRERYEDLLAFVANFNQPPSHITNYHSQYNATQFPQHHSSIPPSHEYQSHMDYQTSSVPQIAYHSPPVSTQPMTEFPQLDSRLAGNATSSGGNNAGGQARVVKRYNFQGEGHMDRKCTQPKRPRNIAWFKEKAMLAKAYESGQILDKEQLAFLADPGIPDGQASQTTIPNTATF
ncbi:hypothetical protein Tco_1017031 [Tanacetum coccineum]|uniref:Integrase, catalytic region, zinc finger, CCHC-type, peptidase aspartic, catalytic n=1 Tax=Tanacetum coccineum TaxID=301880 RepID=A0ABQ5FQF2_9ASTR